jgi:hypothetical protein
MFTQIYINRFELPQEIQNIIKDFIFYRINSMEGMVIQTTKLLKMCISDDISKATSRTNPSAYMTTTMNIKDSFTSEYWEFTGDVFMNLYLGAVNCGNCGNYKYTHIEVHQRSILSQKRIICYCKGESVRDCVVKYEDEEDAAEYQDYLNDIYYDF